MRWSVTVVIRRWWFDDTSAPLITRTSCHDLLNLWLMHMWSIWFSVTWFGDMHVAQTLSKQEAAAINQRRKTARKATQINSKLIIWI